MYEGHEGAAFHERETDLGNLNYAYLGNPADQGPGPNPQPQDLIDRNERIAKRLAEWRAENPQSPEWDQE